VKRTKLFFAVACVLGLVASSFAQFSQTKQSQGIPGYLDSKTGVFSAVSNPQSDPGEASAVTPVTTEGRFEFNFKITLLSKIPTATKIVCAAEIQVIGDSASSSIDEVAAALATRSVPPPTASTDPGTVTFTAYIPHSWKLGSSSTDNVILIYEIEAPVETTPGSTVPFRGSKQTFGSIRVPANGAITTETITATI
jgi:hypothetical protein